MYEHYKKARDAAWKALLDSGIDSLPVDLWKGARNHPHLFQSRHLPDIQG